jgi:protein-disulfide isomerase
LFVAALGLVGIAAVGWWLWRGGASRPVAPGPATAVTTADAGTWTTPEGDPAIGAPTAPVTIVEYSDYQCPNCRQFATEVLPWLKQTWLAQGFVRVVYRDFALRGADSVRAAEAAHCAGEQRRYWSFHDRLFAAQTGADGPPFSPAHLQQIARELGLDRPAFERCVTEGRYRDRVEASTRLAQSQGFQGTPTYIINGRETRGAIPVADWERLFQLYQDQLARGQATPWGASGAPTP